MYNQSKTLSDKEKYRCDVIHFGPFQDGESAIEMVWISQQVTFEASFFGNNLSGSSTAILHEASRQKASRSLKIHVPSTLLHLYHSPVL